MWVRPAAHISHSSLLLTGGSSSSRAAELHNTAAVADTGKLRRRILSPDLLVSTFPNPLLSNPAPGKFLSVWDFTPI